MKAVWDEKCVYTPSLISCCDLCNVEASVRELEKAGIQMLHVDILDGHFSPCMPLGLDTVRQLRERTNMFFDCHVMTTEQDIFIDELLDIGADQIVFHAETQPHIDGMLNRIHAAGAKAGIALKPSTPLSILDYVLEKCDTILLMLINPGYAFLKGEKQVPYAERKVRELRKMIDERGLKTKIEIDGRISRENICLFKKDVDLYVIGSTCVKKETLAADFEGMNRLRQKILEEWK
ncbi:ribulose-phosphate 3-epimerase [bacterium 1XD42-1]|nr:ribulose-phosphate 3-epimerase [Oscillospiraceae bacterium]RKJ53915.1 ribulose-phosphate 3-epimerase [bacterium 1XD42-8]RKJ63194.1 ribulose-phosphate 3-epimerase [bacterium 1XD42-1]